MTVYKQQQHNNPLSTETPPLKTHIDNLAEMVNRKVRAVSLLDLYSALIPSMIYTFLNRREARFALTRIVLRNWLTLYIRPTQIKLNSFTWSTHFLPHSTWTFQLLCLLFIPFSYYGYRASIVPFLRIIFSTDSARALSNLQSCMATVQKWTSSN